METRIGKRRAIRYRYAAEALWALWDVMKREDGARAERKGGWGRGRRREKKKSGIGLIANVCSCDGFTLILRAQTRALRGSRHEARSCRNRITRSLGHSDTEDRDWNYAHTYVE